SNDELLIMSEDNAEVVGGSLKKLVEMLTHESWVCRCCCYYGYNFNVSNQPQITKQGQSWLKHHVSADVPVVHEFSHPDGSAVQAIFRMWLNQCHNHRNSHFQ